MKILFIVPYPKGRIGSQRFRFEQYLDYFEKNGVSYRISSFWSEGGWDILYKDGKYFWKFIFLIFAFFCRFLLLFRIPFFDLIFIHREASHIGPPIFELFIKFVLRKKIIYDFDDAIWLSNYSSQNAFVDRFKCYSKVSKICKWSDFVVCGNKYLEDYAKQYTIQTAIIPTTIDMDNYHNQTKNQRTDQIVIGWTGVATGLKYVRRVMLVLKKLSKSHNVKFIVISNEPFESDLDFVVNVSWRKVSEIEDLLRMNIGIMPMSDDEWSRGKCGFKALQYMALGIPPIVSPIGVNSEIVEDGVNGFLATSDKEWEEKLSKLIESPELREEMGRKARQTVIERYSVESQKSRYLKIIQEVFEK